MKTQTFIFRDSFPILLDAALRRRGRLDLFLKKSEWLPVNNFNHIHHGPMGYLLTLISVQADTYPTTEERNNGWFPYTHYGNSHEYTQELLENDLAEEEMRTTPGMRSPSIRFVRINYVKFCQEVLRTNNTRR